MNNDGYDADNSRDYIMADLYLRITALENLLINKQLITEAALQEHLRLLAIRIADILGMPIEQLSPPKTAKSGVIVNNDKEAQTEDILKLFSLTSSKISKNN